MAYFATSLWLALQSSTPFRNYIILWCTPRVSKYPTSNIMMVGGVTSILFLRNPWPSIIFFLPRVRLVVLSMQHLFYPFPMSLFYQPVIEWVPRNLENNSMGNPLDLGNFSPWSLWMALLSTFIVKTTISVILSSSFIQFGKVLYTNIIPNKIFTWGWVYSVS